MADPAKDMPDDDGDDKDRDDDKKKRGTVPSGLFGTIASAIGQFIGQQVNPAVDGAPKKFLHALRAGNHDAMTAMIAEGFDINTALLQDGDTALHIAAAAGDTAMAEWLVKAGANPHQPRDTTDNVTPLALAIDKRRTAMAALLWRIAGDSGQPNGHTALHRAARTGDTSVIGALLAAGCDPLATTDTGVDAFYIAVHSGHALAAARLLKAPGALHRIMSVTAATDTHKRTALHLAVERGMHALVNTLLTLGLPVNTPDGSGRTPLQATIAKGDLGMARLLIRHHADINGGRMPALNFAASDNVECGSAARIDMMRLLLRHGADPLATDDNGRTALVEALYVYDHKALRLLLDAGCDAAAVDGCGVPVMLHALFSDDAETLAIVTDHLRARGQEINQRHANDNKTVLMTAAQMPNLGAVRLLLDAGVDPRGCDLYGKSALDYARETAAGGICVTALEDAIRKFSFDKTRKKNNKTSFPPPSNSP